MTDSSAPRRWPLRPLTAVLIGLVAIVGAFTVLRSALRAGGTSPSARPVVTPTRDEFIARAGDAMRDSAWGQAEAILNEAISIYDRDQDLRLQLADVLRKDSRSALAYDQVAAALAIGPQSAELHFRAGLLASESDQHAKAIEHFTAARAAAPTNAEYVLYLAQAQIAADQIPEAKVSLLATVHIDPDSAIAWGTLADIFLQENKPDLAIENIRKARALQPDLTLWRLVEARALKRKGQPEEALQLLIAIPGPEQRDSPVLSLMAECYALLGRPHDAADRYGAASDARPTDAALALEAAEWYKRAGDNDRALHYADNAAMLGNPDASALALELRGG